MNKSSYEKCVDLIVKINECIVAGDPESKYEPLEDRLGKLRKKLDVDQNEVVGRLITSLFVGGKDFDIDEATGGSLDND